jgi:hypothetical protein
MPFPNQVNVQPGVAVAGDFASKNPRASLLAGAGALVTGPAGLTIGRFAWVTQGVSDDVGAPGQANSFGTGPVAGFVHREQQGLITTYLTEAAMTIPQGFPCTIMMAGDFWVKNEGTTQALVGQYAFANFANGAATFGAGTPSGIGTSNNGNSASISAGIAAGTTTFSGSVAGNILTVQGSVSGTIQIGGTMTGGTGLAANTQIVSQLSGTPGGIGTYALNIPEQSVNNGSGSVIFTETFGLLTAGTVSSGTLGVGDTLSGGGVGPNTVITALGTGAGGAGTYIVNVSQSISAGTAMTAATNVQTKWIAMSTGNPGELVKISSWVNG